MEERTNAGVRKNLARTCGRARERQPEKTSVRSSGFVGHLANFFEAVHVARTLFQSPHVGPRWQIGLSNCLPMKAKESTKSS